MISLKTKIILVVAIVLNILAIGLFFFVFSDIEKNNGQVYLLLEELRNQTRKESVIKMARVNLKRTEHDREKLNYYFVEKDKEKGVAHLINNLESLGRDIGVSVSVSSIVLTSYKSNNPDIVKGQSVLEEVFLDLNAEGGWSDLIFFSSLVQTVPLRIKIEKMSIDKFEDKKGWNLILNLKVLKLK